MQGRKHTRYRETAAPHHAELLPFCVETCGGMAPDAIKLLSAMGEMGDEMLCMWHRHVVIRHLVGSVAMVVQRENVVAWLSGYSRALAAMSHRSRKEREREEVDCVMESEPEDTEAQEER